MKIQDIQNAFKRAVFGPQYIRLTGDEYHYYDSRLSLLDSFEFKSSVLLGAAAVLFQGVENFNGQALGIGMLSLVAGQLIGRYLDQRDLAKMGKLDTCIDKRPERRAFDARPRFLNMSAEDQIEITNQCASIYLGCIGSAAFPMIAYLSANNSELDVSVKALGVVAMMLMGSMVNHMGYAYRQRKILLDDWRICPPPDKKEEEKVPDMLPSPA